MLLLLRSWECCLLAAAIVSCRVVRVCVYMAVVNERNKREKKKGEGTGREKESAIERDHKDFSSHFIVDTPDSRSLTKSAFSCVPFGIHLIPPHNIAVVVVACCRCFYSWCCGMW